VIDDSGRPRLSSDARLRFDRHLQRYLLLNPESGVLLSGNAASIVQLCTGENTVADIVRRLTGADGGAKRADIERDVHAFLGQLVERMFVDMDG
jgi:pyrroloquinoline quinone biosynthesis protein D